MTASVSPTDLDEMPPREPRRFAGTAVFPGVAIGPAVVLDRRGMTVALKHVAPDRIPAEVAAVRDALRAVARRLAETAETVAAKLGGEVAAIFTAHRSIVCDPHLHELIEAQIREHRCNAALAVRTVLRRYAKVFRELPQASFAERATDIQDIERQLLDHLHGAGHRPLDGLTEPVIVLAEDLTPSETASFDRGRILALATEAGGRTSHTAIVAGALELPAIVGIGEMLGHVEEGATVVVDGHRGYVWLDPDADTLARYRAAESRLAAEDRQLDALRDLPAVTTDGDRVELLGNIEFPSEAAHCLERGAVGVGLYRTEFLYLDGAAPPDEQAHYEAYAKVLQTLGPDQEVCLRTLDLGADKFPEALRRPGDRPRHVEANPFLGLRSIRLSLQRPDVFKVQLRAILRASMLGKVMIMFPLISAIRELRHCRLILADVMEELDEAGIPFRRDIPVGMMVEVPSAALQADRFAAMVDFFSIGTNDLIQYTLAADRNNEQVAGLYNAADPAVLTLVQRVIDAGARHGVPVTVCGEMSGDPLFTRLLIGMGLRRLSLTPHNIPTIKRIVRETSAAEAQAMRKAVAALDSAEAIDNYLHRQRLGGLDADFADHH